MKRNPFQPQPPTKKYRIAVSLTREQFEIVTAQARRMRISRGAFVRQTLSEFFDREFGLNEPEEKK